MSYIESCVRWNLSLFQCTKFCKPPSWIYSLLVACSCIHLSPCDFSLFYPITQTETSRYPCIVALVDKLDGILTCGGSLIAQDTILTAAQCVYGIEDIYSLLMNFDIVSLSRLSNSTILNKFIGDFFRE